MADTKPKRGGARPGAGRKPGQTKAVIKRESKKLAGNDEVIKRRGKPTDFRRGFVKQAQQLCKLGATDQELADFFGVAVRTIYRWKAEHEDFGHALKIGKSEADDRVERSLFARANGYEHDEVDIRVVDKQIVQTAVRKFYPPDTAAAIFWLKNRRADTWRDKVDHELGGPNGGPLQVVVKRYTDV